MARVKYQQVVVASTTNAAGATTRGAIDVRNRDGGVITLRVTNGSTGPNASTMMRIMYSHNTGATPSTDAEGTEWKVATIFFSNLGNNEVTSRSFEFGPAVQHVQVEFTGNTGQGVTVEAIASTVDYQA